MHRHNYLQTWTNQNWNSTLSKSPTNTWRWGWKWKREPEEKIRNKSIYSPADYLGTSRKQDRTTAKCVVWTTSDPAKKKGDPQVVDISCLIHASDRCILYKLFHEGEWEELFVRGNSTHNQRDCFCSVILKHDSPAYLLQNYCWLDARVAFRPTFPYRNFLCW